MEKAKTPACQPAVVGGGLKDAELMRSRKERKEVVEEKDKSWGGTVKECRPEPYRKGNTEEIRSIQSALVAAQPAPVTPMGPGVPCLPQPEYLWL